MPRPEQIMLSTSANYSYSMGVLIWLQGSTRVALSFSPQSVPPVCLYTYTLKAFCDIFLNVQSQGIEGRHPGKLRSMELCS